MIGTTLIELPKTNKITSSCRESNGRREEYYDKDNNLDVFIDRGFLRADEEDTLFNRIREEIPWYRVKYVSERHSNSCETPCWTNMFGGLPDIVPYQPIPDVLQELINTVQMRATHTAQYNAVLVRLYFDGQDNITWHTDGRTFLGDQPTIASLSLGARCAFELRKMNQVWPCAETPNGGIDPTVPQIKLQLSGGDLLVMQGKTQQSWHHRVPTEKGRGPRININLRYILPDRDETTIRGVRAFYKYMVCGDSKTEEWEMKAPSFSYLEIVKARGPMHLFTVKRYTPPAPGATAVVNSSSITSSAKTMMTSTSITVCESKNINSEIACATTNNTAVDSWTCLQCTFMNSSSDSSCEICLEKRTKIQRIAEDSKTKIKASKQVISSFFKPLNKS